MTAARESQRTRTLSGWSWYIPRFWSLGSTSRQPQRKREHLGSQPRLRHPRTRAGTRLRSLLPRAAGAPRGRHGHGSDDREADRASPRWYCHRDEFRRSGYGVHLVIATWGHCLMSAGRILVVDDDPQIRRVMRVTARRTWVGVGSVGPELGGNRFRCSPGDSWQAPDALISTLRVVGSMDTATAQTAHRVTYAHRTPSARSRNCRSFRALRRRDLT